MPLWNVGLEPITFWSPFKSKEFKMCACKQISKYMHVWMRERVRHSGICKALEEDLNPPSWPMQTPL